MSKYQIGINEKVRAAWSNYYVRLLKTHFAIEKNMNVLDYGCGLFDIGKLLLDQAGRVDGFDISHERTAILQSFYKDKPSVRIFSEKEMILDHRYDVIIVNSVIQYFKSEKELSDVLIFLKNKLNSKESRIIISDIIPKKYSPFKDSLWLLFFSFKNKIFFEILNEFFMAFLSRTHHSFLKLDIKDLKRVGEACGLSVKITEKNLTPSASRYTSILSEKQ